MIYGLALAISFAGGCFAATRRHLAGMSRVAGALYGAVSVVMTSCGMFSACRTGALARIGCTGCADPVQRGYSKPMSFRGLFGHSLATGSHRPKRPPIPKSLVSMRDSGAREAEPQDRDRRGPPLYE
jgi:hypothetical protein